VRDSRLNGVSLSPHVHGFAQTAFGRVEAIDRSSDREQDDASLVFCMAASGANPMNAAASY
jgi:hypothetical protein